MKNLFLKICARASFFIKLQAFAYNFIKKEALTQVFSCEFCKISTNTFSYKTPPVAASVAFGELWRAPSLSNLMILT